MDAGTIDSLVEAANFVKIIKERQGIQIAAIEEVAFYNKWISAEQLKSIAKLYGNSEYGKYLMAIAERKSKFSPQYTDLV